MKEGRIKPAARGVQREFLIKRRAEEWRRAGSDKARIAQSKGAGSRCPGPTLLY